MNLSCDAVCTSLYLWLCHGLGTTSRARLLWLQDVTCTGVSIRQLEGFTPRIAPPVSVTGTVNAHYNTLKTHWKQRQLFQAYVQESTTHFAACHIAWLMSNLRVPIHAMSMKPLHVHVLVVPKDVAMASRGHETTYSHNISTQNSATVYSKCSQYNKFQTIYYSVIGVALFSVWPSG